MKSFPVFRVFGGFRNWLRIRGFDKQNYVELYAATTGLEAFGALIYKTNMMFREYRHGT